MGVVGRIDTRFGLPGGNDRYGVELMFAKDKTGAACRFCYSIEPMCPEPSEGFYKKFLLVEQGQKVRKGDVIAYLYTLPSSDDGCHIHFHLMIDGKQGFWLRRSSPLRSSRRSTSSAKASREATTARRSRPAWATELVPRRTRLGPGRRTSFEGAL
jgi:hypothetical protein